MVLTPRFAALFLVFTSPPLVASDAASMVERFDAAVARMSPTTGPSVADAVRLKRSAADFLVERRLNIKVDFPGDVEGTMYGGLLHGEAAVFTRSGDHLDVTVMRNGETQVTSFDAPMGGEVPADTVPFVAAPASRRMPRSVDPGHVENPAAYVLHFHFLKHDDLIDRDAQELHARYVAWWLADMATNVLPVEPLRASYTDRAPWLTSMEYGDADSLDRFEGTLKALNAYYRFDVTRTYKHKFVLLTAGLPMPGTTGVAFEGGNEAIASVAGRARIVAHEIGHMLGATHAEAETRSWWGCETNMLPNTSGWRGDCLEYTAANQRAIRSYMRHGPDSLAPRKMADAPPLE
jgi:Metallo-peptidase family M12B Reprolysin-like